MMRRRFLAMERPLVGAAVCLTVVLAGCRTSTRKTTPPVYSFRDSTAYPSQIAPQLPEGAIQSVACAYVQSPWLSFDAAGDKVPEGVYYRVYLNDGSGKGVAHDGIFHVELYTLEAGENDVPAKRELVSDWHYPTSAIPHATARVFGTSYHLQLRWASKGIAGHDVELVTRFEDETGRIVGASTKRLVIPEKL